MSIFLSNGSNAPKSKMLVFSRSKRDTSPAKSSLSNRSGCDISPLSYRFNASERVKWR